MYDQERTDRRQERREHHPRNPRGNEPARRAHEAHRYIQKCSMDSGTNMVETAQMILSMMNA